MRTRLGANKKRWLVAGACIVAALATAVWVRANHRSGDWPSAVAEIRQLSVEVATAGDLDTERATVLSSSIKGDRGKLLELVPEGKQVSAGEVLVRLDPTQLQKDVARLQGDVSSKDAVVSSATQLFDMERAQAEAAIREAEFSYKEARQDYGKQDAYIKDLTQIGQGDASIAIELEQAQKRREQLQSKLERAEANIAKVRKEGFYKVAAAKSNVDKVSAELQTTKTALQDAVDELSKTTLVAPSPGIAVLAEAFRENVKRKPRVGDTAWQGQPLVFLPDTTSFIAKGRIRETDFHRIQIGSDALVKVDALPSAALKGKVLTIGAIAVREAEGGSGDKFFDVVVRLTDLHPSLRPGMTSRIVIQSRQVKGLAIPIGAVFRDLAGPYCWKLPRMGGPVRVPLDLGDRDDAFVEVRQGLAAGDIVALVPPSRS